MIVKPYNDFFVIETTIAGLFQAEQEANVNGYRSIDMHRASKRDCAIQEDETDIIILAVPNSWDGEPMDFAVYTSNYMGDYEIPGVFEINPHQVARFGDKLTSETLARKLFPNLSEYAYRS